MPAAVAPDPRTVDDATIMQRVRAGLTYVEVGLRLGVSPHRVSRIARAHGYDAVKRIHLTAKLRAERKAKARAVKAFRRAQAEAEAARRAALRGPKREVPVYVRAPAWVIRADLADDYRDHARAFDEHAAARHCRALLSEQRRLTSLDTRLQGRASDRENA